MIHPEISTVIISANWGPYFAPDRMLGERREGVLIMGTAAVQHALATTLQWLRDHGKRVILIGSVPVYDQSVPLGLALEAITGQGVLHLSASEQRHKNAAFTTVVEVVKPSASFRFVDPIQWMCADNCQVMKDGLSFYRDAHHLSVDGAVAMQADLAKALGFSTVTSRHLEQAAALSNR